MLSSAENILASRLAVITLSAAFVLSQLWIIMTLGDTGKEVAKLQTVCLVHPGPTSTGIAAREILEEWTSEDIYNFQRHFLLDKFFHPVLYALFFTSALYHHLTHDDRSKDNPHRALCGRIGTIIIFCGALCDILENIQHSSINFDSGPFFASNDVLYGACVFASAKWVIMGTVAGWLSWRFFHDPSATSATKSIRTATKCRSNDDLGSCWKGPRPTDFLNTPCQQAGLLKVQEQDIPWTLSASGSRHDHERSYTVSPYAHYIGYALDEIQIHLSQRPKLSWLAGTFVNMVGFIIDTLHFDDSIYFNNLLLSTNLWPSIHWSHDLVNLVNHQLFSQARSSGNPNRAIVWRSIDALSQPLLTKTLQESSSCLLIPARVVNWTDLNGKDLVTSKVYEKKDFRRDVQLFREKVGWDIAQQQNVDNWHNSKYQVMTISAEELTLEDATTIVDLFRQLYITKYSKRNPQLTPSGLVRMAIEEFFRVDVLRIRKNGRIVGFCTWSVQDDVTNSSFVGYDIAGDKDKELYRLVMMMIHNNLVESGLSKCHMSGGANRFKRRRGAKSTIEYNAVFVDHLPWYQQSCWKMAKFIVDKIITVERAK